MILTVFHVHPHGLFIGAYVFHKMHFYTIFDNKPPILNVTVISNCRFYLTFETSNAENT